MNTGASSAAGEEPPDGPATLRVASGVSRLLEALGYSTLREFTLACGRRVDVIGLGERGSFLIVEVKSSLADLKADGKWPEYLEFCDSFYFAVPEGFPVDALPGEGGVIVADVYQGAIVRPAPRRTLHASRRRAQILRFALTAAGRLSGILDLVP